MNLYYVLTFPNIEIRMNEIAVSDGITFQAPPPYIKEELEVDINEVSHEIQHT